jgi:hypothetical protein
LHIYEAVIDELMRKGLANATQVVLNLPISHDIFRTIFRAYISLCQFQQHPLAILLQTRPCENEATSLFFTFQALLTGCSAGGLATILHCDDFSARFPREASVKCLADAGFFLDV